MLSLERKVKLTIIILSLIGIITVAIAIPIIIFLPKVSFEKQIVDEDFSVTNYIDDVDLDNDDDLDIFTAAGNEIAFWENNLV